MGRLLWACLCICGWQDDEASLAAPTRDGKPVRVSVMLYLQDFARITPREETYDITAYLELSWVDPRLAAPGSGDRPRKVDPRRHWTPRVFFENAVDQPRYHAEPDIEVDSNGKVTSGSIFSAKFSSEMNLRRFPFDTQDLVIDIGAFDNSKVVHLVAAGGQELVDPKAFVTDWTIGDAKAFCDPHSFVPGGEPYPRYMFQVQVTRKATFFIWRVMVPLTLLVLVAFAVFWFEPVGLQPQISTCLGALIALVAFNFAIDFSLPKVAYLTLVDKHALIGFTCVACAVVEVTLVHRNVDRGRVDTAKRIQRWARVLFPSAYVLAIASNIFLSLH